MHTKLRLLAPMALLLALTACGGPAVSSGEQQAPGQGGGQKEEPLTGDLKQQVEQAALARFPGMVVKSEHDAERPGMFAVEIQQNNGQTVEVYLDKGLQVSGTKDEGREQDGDGN